jgi:hypothetical protein
LAIFARFERWELGGFLVIAVREVGGVAVFGACSSRDGTYWSVVAHGSWHDGWSRKWFGIIV